MTILLVCSVLMRLTTHWNALVYALKFQTKIFIMRKWFRLIFVWMREMLNLFISIALINDLLILFRHHRPNSASAHIFVCVWIWCGLTMRSFFLGRAQTYAFRRITLTTYLLMCRCICGYGSISNIFCINSFLLLPRPWIISGCKSETFVKAMMTGTDGQWATLRHHLKCVYDALMYASNDCFRIFNCLLWYSLIQNLKNLWMPWVYENPTACGEIRIAYFLYA